jgi:hypothetical protein
MKSLKKGLHDPAGPPPLQASHPNNFLFAQFEYD